MKTAVCCPVITCFCSLKNEKLKNKLRSEQLYWYRYILGWINYINNREIILSKVVGTFSKASIALTLKLSECVCILHTVVHLIWGGYSPRRPVDAWYHG